ncbi:MAG: RsmD family RNA methyltransferase, partial [Myxococcota bacterium]|nr:RsmD family RNA methyltransferase [Myxococcota bacterium]
MRIIGGKFRGRRLTAPAGLATRPMIARVREALYNILADRIVDARVADCFSGTGAVGLEALSRGARSVDFFEAGRHATGTLDRNISTLGVQDACR